MFLSFPSEHSISSVNTIKIFKNWAYLDSEYAGTHFLFPSKILVWNGTAE